MVDDKSKDDKSETPPDSLILRHCNGNAVEAEKLRAQLERQEQSRRRELLLSSGSSSRRPRRRRRRERLAGSAEEQLRRAIGRPLSAADVKAIVREVLADDAAAAIEHVLRKKGVIR
jgi:hypothetical protein